MNYRHSRIHYTAASGSPAGRGDPFGALRARAAGPIGRALAVAAGALVLVAALFVSAVVFSVLLVAGVIGGGWFWWKTRGLRREIRERLAQMQQMQPGQPPRSSNVQSPNVQSPFARPRSADAERPEGDIIDGDYVRETGPRSS